MADARETTTRACDADLPADALEDGPGGLRFADGDGRAAAWLAARLDEPPRHRVGGRETTQGAAVDAAAALLAAARAPLVLGLGRASVETARAAVALADRLGAAIDPSGGHVDGAGGRASALRGASTATLGDVAEHAEGVVVWREDPETSHPGLLRRLGLDDPAARAAAGRRLLVVDDRETATAALADAVLPLPSGRDHDVLRALLALERGVALDPRLELPEDGLRTVLRTLGGGQHGAVLHGAGLAGGLAPADASPAGGDAAEPARPAGSHRAVVALHALTRALNGRTHAVSVELRRDPGARGAEDALSWQTGLAAAVDLGPGVPVAEPGVTDAATLLRRGAVDAALVIADDPAAWLPAAARERLREIPTAVVADVAPATDARDDVVLAVAAAGLGAAGVLHRLDGVPVPVQAPVASDLPAAEDVLGRVLAALDGEGSADGTVTP